MPLALNRTGVVFKKCDMSGHRRDFNRACGAATCQHTCKDTEPRPGQARRRSAQVTELQSQGGVFGERWN
jgi:hypothetical protein